METKLLTDASPKTVEDVAGMIRRHIAKIENEFFVEPVRDFESEFEREKYCLQFHTVRAFCWKIIEIIQPDLEVDMDDNLRTIYPSSNQDQATLQIDLDIPVPKSTEPEASLPPGSSPVPCS